MDDLTPTLLAALSDGMNPHALRELVERVIFQHNGLLPLAQRIAPGAAWVCDPSGLGYPSMYGEEFFVGVCDAGTGPGLTISVGASPNPGAAGWRRRAFDLGDERKAVADAYAWLMVATERGMLARSYTQEARAKSAAACLRSLSWDR